MPVAQNTPRITKGVHHTLTKWKMRMLTREAVPTATTASRIEIGIRVTMLGHLKCLPNQPRSNRIESAQFRRRHRTGRRSTASERHVDPSILCRTKAGRSEEHTSELQSH